MKNFEERYNRHSLIDWFPRELVEQLRVAVVGCGAVGNEVSKNLALLGVKSIDLFDFDTIEIHNLTRSVLFREADVGRTKVSVVAERLRELEPRINATAYHGDFWDQISLQAISEYDFVISCVDNFTARVRLNNLCLLTRTNFINTGIDSRFCQVELFPFASRQNCACYECNLPPSAYARMKERYSCGWLKKIAFREKKIPTTIVTSSISGALATSMALNHCRSPETEGSVRVLQDSFSLTSARTLIARSDNCPACQGLDAQCTIVRANSAISSLFGEFDTDQVVVEVSDPVLVSTHCKTCDDGELTVIFDRASKYDASIIRCSRCEQDSVEVDIRDSFSIKELQGRFGGLSMPVKFVSLSLRDRKLVLEMENTCQK